MPSRLLFTPTVLISTELFALPPSLRNNCGGSVQIINHEVNVAVIVNVSEGDSSAHARLHQRTLPCDSHFAKRPIAIVFVQQAALAIVFQLRINMAIGYEQINPAVVVIVKELSSPTNVRDTYCGDFSCIRNIRERIMAVIMIERVVLFSKVGSKDVKPAIMIIVSLLSRPCFPARCRSR